ncbi:hypothetical protein [Mycolicibacterium conceptionense]|uniref:hypothetical protein n=1 Tax=Mycolicibacterium conceptionense TaxID=451644 RepID=UPI000AC8C6D6|nr:hypothetical protein [Mycolicibacterium conceptionense]
MANLFNFELRVSGDSAKPDLELICLECGEHLCDAEHSDSLHSLVATCEDHAKQTGHGV